MLSHDLANLLLSKKNRPVFVVTGEDSRDNPCLSEVSGAGVRKTEDCGDLSDVLEEEKVIVLHTEEIG